MNNHNNIFEHFLGGFIAHRSKSCILLPVPLLLVHTAHRPEHAVRRLITYLHPFRLDTFLLERIQHIECMLTNCLKHRLVVVVLPCGRDGLMGRVGKEIRIMDIYHDSLPRLGCTLGESHHIGFVTPAGSMVYPYTQTNGVHALSAQAFYTIVAKHTVLLHLAEPTQITTLRPRTTRTVGTIITTCQNNCQRSNKKESFHIHSI